MHPADPTPRILAIVGPTATGKTSLALRLAQTLPAEIVNADALQVYRGLDVGTAKPTPDELARVPHHLVDVLDPGERFSAGEFARRARRAIEQIHARNRWAFVVGGSGFYHKALFEGLTPLPRSQPEIRATLQARARQEGPEPLHRELAARDPQTANRLPPGDTQRIVRALEVVEATGRPLSEWIAAHPAPARPLSALHVGLTLPRPILYDRIAVRVTRMVERGWVDEVRGLLARGVSPDAPAFQAIGYRQLVGHLRGKATLDEAVAEIIQATRRFAKRQRTWFRKEPQVNWFDARELAADVSGVLELLEPIA